MPTIEEGYRELNYPSKRKLALALHARQIPFTGEQLEELTRTWRPYRSVGSWYLWRGLEAKLF